MRSKFFASIVLLFAALFASYVPALAQCDLREDTSEIRGIEIGRFKLRFDAWSLNVRDPIATPKGHLLAFTIGRPFQTIDVQIGSEPNRSSAFHLDGSLKLKQAIEGTILEEISGGNCERTITINRSSFAGNELTVRRATLPPWFGGTLSLQNAKLTISDNSPIISGPNTSFGTIFGSSDRLAVRDARISFPLAPVTEKRMTLQAGSSSALQFDMSSMATRIARANLRSQPTIFTTWSSNFAGLKADLSAVKVKSVVVTVKPNEVTGELTAADGQAKTLSHSGPLGADLVRPAAFSWRSLEFEATQADSKSIVLSGDQAAFSDLLLKSDIRIGKDPVDAIVTGLAQLNVRKLSRTDIDATVLFDTPAVTVAEGSSIGVNLTKLKITIAGTKVAANITSSATLGRFALPSFSFTGAAALTTKATVGTIGKFEAHATGGSIQLPQGSEPGLIGSISDLDIAGSLTDLTSAGLRIDIPSKAFDVKAKLSRYELAVLGGKLQIPSKALQLVNGAALVLLRTTAPQAIDIKTQSASLSGAKFRPNHSATTFDAMKAPLSISDPKLALIVGAATGTQSFSLNYQAKLPGFSLRPPPPLKSINVTLGGYDLEVEGLDVGSLSIDFQGLNVEVALNDIAILLGDIRTSVGTDGKPSTTPVLAGRFMSPITIAKAFVLYQLWPQPFAAEDMGLEQAHIALSVGSLATPGVFEVTNAAIDLSLKKVNLTAIDGNVSVTNGIVAWRDSISGSAQVASATLVLSGKRSAPDGKLDISIPNVQAAGTANVGLGSDNPNAFVNCTVQIPVDLRIGMRGIRGSAAFANGKLINGMIGADEVDKIQARFSGDKACNFMLTLTIEYRFNVPCFPEVWKTCEAKDSKQFKLPARLIAYLFNHDIELRDVRFDIDHTDEFHPTFKWCHAHLHRLYPIPPKAILVTIEPDFSGIPWPFNQLADAAAKVVLAPIYYMFENSIVDAIAFLSIIGVGDANAIQDNCKFS